MAAPWLRQCENCRVGRPWKLKEEVFMNDLLKCEKKMIFSKASGCWRTCCPKGAKRSNRSISSTWLRVLPAQGMGKDPKIYTGAAAGRAVRLRS